MKFYEIWSGACGEMISDRQTDGRTKGGMDGRTPFGEHNKNICIYRTF